MPSSVTFEKSCSTSRFQNTIISSGQSLEALCLMPPHLCAPGARPEYGREYPTKPLSKVDLDEEHFSLFVGDHPPVDSCSPQHCHVASHTGNFSFSSPSRIRSRSRFSTSRDHYDVDPAADPVLTHTPPPSASCRLFTRPNYFLTHISALLPLCVCPDVRGCSQLSRRLSLSSRYQARGFHCHRWLHLQS
ncbi:hypothetical protein BJV78DRAFT_831834 [Lactifluus subvellereus]|nr:hypothetical protein BJV78DRAFT_831834 [Lactifluus subvellereus]